MICCTKLGRRDVLFLLLNNCIMRKYFVIPFLIIAANVQPGFAQHLEKRDSLLTALSLSKEDTNRVNTLLLLGEQFERTISDSAIFYFRKAGAVSKKINYPLGTLKYIANISEELDRQSKHEEALALNLQSIELAKKVKLPKRLAAAYSNTGVSYYYLADYKTCTDYFMKAVSILEQQQLTTRSDKKDLAGLYANLTGILTELKQDDKAYSYGLKSIAMSRELKDSATLCRSLTNTGTVLFNQKRLDTALICLQQSRDIAAATGNKASEEAASISIANVYQLKGNFAGMMANAERGLALSVALEDSDGISKSLLYKAIYFFNKKEYATARTFAKQGLQIAQQNKLDNHIADEYLILSDIELAAGNLGEYNRLRTLADSMNEVVLSEEILKTTQEMEAKYSSAQKQMQIDSLAKEKKIQGLEIKQKRQINLGLIAALVVVSLIGLLYYRNYQNRQKLMEADAQLQKQRITELENEKLLLATQGIVQGQEEERTRLAKDLHDGLGGILSSAKYSLSNMKQNLIITPENATAFERTMTMLDQSITELRRVAHNMMPETLMKLSLSEALQDYCTQVTQSGALNVTYQSYDTENLPLENTVKITVYRVVQELINNTIKHAGASTSVVQLMHSDQKLNITVEDDGKGFDKTILDTATGIGYKNLQSRIDFLKGTMDIQSQMGEGTSVYIEIPLGA